MPTKKLNIRDLVTPKNVSAFDAVNKEFGRVQINETGGVDENKFLLFFRHFGIPLDRSVNQLVGQCPVCSKQKFFANAASGQWDCKTCVTAGFTSAAGNVYTFLPWLHEHWLNLTTEEDYADLAKRRKYTISIDIMREFGLAFNRITNEWMIPAWSQQKTLANLYSYRRFKNDEGKTFWQIVSAPSPIQQVLYNFDKVSPDVNKILWICEGHWDCLALITLLSRTNQRLKHDVVAICGSAGFPKQYVNIMNNRKVNVVTDNDDAGRKHTMNITNLLASTGTQPDTYQVIEWKRGLPDKYDISDACAGLEIA